MNISTEVMNAAKDAAFMEAYETWRSQPVTLRILRLAREAARPTGLPTANAESALYYAGQVDACEALSDLLLDFRSFTAKYSQAAEAARQPLVSTYGATMPKRKG